MTRLLPLLLIVVVLLQVLLIGIVCVLFDEARALLAGGATLVWIVGMVVVTSFYLDGAAKAGVPWLRRTATGLLVACCWIVPVLLLTGAWCLGTLRASDRAQP